MHEMKKLIFFIFLLFIQTNLNAEGKSVMTEHITLSKKIDGQNQYYTVTGHLVARAGKETQLKEVLLSLIAPTLQEEGCIHYSLYQSKNNPRQFMFYENWSSKEAFEKHGETPHIKAWRLKKPELLEEPNDVTSWERLIP